MPAHLHARVRLVASLREGSSRMLSWYNHRVVATNVKSEFCKGEKGRVVGGQFKPTFEEHAACELGLPSSNELHVGMYINGVARWAKEWPRDQLLVINMGAMVSDPDRYMQEVRA